MLIWRLLLVAVLAIGFQAASARTPSAPETADPFSVKGCVKRDIGNAYLTKVGGFALLRLDGARIWDTGYDPLIDNGDLTYRFNLVVYNSPAGLHWALTRSEFPSNQEYTSFCAMAGGLVQNTRMSDLSREPWEALVNTLHQNSPEEALRRCEKLRPIVLARNHEKLENFGGKVILSRDAQLLRQSMARGDNRPLSVLREEGNRRDEQDLEAAKRSGDTRCDIIDKQLQNAGSAGTILVGQMFGDDVAQDIPQVAFSLLLSRNLHRWIIVETIGEGATIAYGDGFKAEILPKSYEALFPH